MGLKLKIKKVDFDALSEAVKVLYKADGGDYVLDVDGAVPKERLDEFRNNNIALTQQLEKFKSVDPTKYAELLKIQQEVEAGELIKAGKLEEAVNLRVGHMKTELEGRAKTAETALEKANRQLASLMIDSQARTVAAKLGVKPTALDDVVLRARAIYTMENGAAVPKDDKGVIFGKDGTTPMPIDEWGVNLKKTAPHLFQGSEGSGAGGGGRTGAEDLSKMSGVDLIQAGLSEHNSNLIANLPSN